MIEINLCTISKGVHLRSVQKVMTRQKKSTVPQGDPPASLLGYLRPSCEPREPSST